MADSNNNNNNQPQGNRPPQGSPGPGNNIYWIYAALFAFVILAFLLLRGDNNVREKKQSDFSADIEAGRVSEVLLKYTKGSSNAGTVLVTLSESGKEHYKIKPPMEKGPHYAFETGNLSSVQENANANGVRWNYEEAVSFAPILSILIPIAVIVFLWIFFMRRMGGGGPGGQIFNIGKSRANLYDKENKVNVTFNDVAGLDEAKVEVQEVVEFLKSPQKFTKLGGHIPKGVLLVGPPGTGKTLLAKAVAGEAKVPFFSLSGSDFVEMFVGVGAARVRDLFKQAKEKAPCIVFIDEIDAVGRSRGRNSMTGGNDERENTLNQLLVEMDGFGSDTGVIIMAATNRPDVLDPALLRAGRFDRQIGVDRPDLKAREAIFDVHLKKLKLGETVAADKLAAQTPGFVGADIMNVCNEAALIAARKNKEAIEMDDFQDAVDRVIGGLEKKSKIISREEKRIVAYHEAGHAVAGWFLEHAHPLVKVSIVPRGLAALGYAQYLPKEQYLYTRAQMLDTMCMTLGGRAAEDIVFNEISTGAQNDLERITQTAYSMVTLYGMNKNVGQVSFRSDNEYSFGKPYSEDLAKTIDQEVKKIIDSAYDRTRKLLVDHRDQLESIAQELLEKEVIFKDDLVRLIGERPFEDKTLADEVKEQLVEDIEETPKVEKPPVKKESDSKEDSVEKNDEEPASAE